MIEVCPNDDIICDTQTITNSLRDLLMGKVYNERYRYIGKHPANLFEYNLNRDEKLFSNNLSQLKFLKNIAFV